MDSQIQFTHSTLNLPKSVYVPISKMNTRYFDAVSATSSDDSQPTRTELIRHIAVHILSPSKNYRRISKKINRFGNSLTRIKNRFSFTPRRQIESRLPIYEEDIKNTDGIIISTYDPRINEITFRG